MSRSIEFWVSGIPKQQPRPRAFARKMGNKFVARVFDDGTAEHWKSCIANAAKPHLTGEPIHTPVALTIAFHFPRPKAHFRSNGELRPGAQSYHTSRPDIDNLAKAVMDALTQIGVWRDDTQVTSLFSTKRYAHHAPGALVNIREILD